MSQELVIQVPPHPARETATATNQDAAALPAALTIALIGAFAIGLAVQVDALGRSSATYDEVTYLRVAARWWRTGDQQEIARRGSPLLFWKLQQAPAFWILDRAGRGAWIDDPISHEEPLLRAVRLASLWIWAAALGLTALWSRQLYGPRAMALAAWLFVLSPNLLAHGALATMEMPLVMSTTLMTFLFWKFLSTGASRWFWLSAATGGLAFSCKYTTVLFPPLLASVWAVDRWLAGERQVRRLALSVAGGMIAYVVVLLMTDMVLTGFRTIALSGRTGPHPSIDARLGPWLGRWVSHIYELPIPQDWVGLATQLHLQRSGGSSYLLGTRRMYGWWYYYLVALSVKVPLSMALLFVGRIVLNQQIDSDEKRQDRDRGWILPALIALFLGATALGSTRNYGIRYLLPLAPWRSSGSRASPSSAAGRVVWPWRGCSASCSRWRASTPTS